MLLPLLATLALAADPVLGRAAIGDPVPDQLDRAPALGGWPAERALLVCTHDTDDATIRRIRGGVLWATFSRRPDPDASVSHASDAPHSDAQTALERAGAELERRGWTPLPRVNGEHDGQRWHFERGPRAVVLLTRPTGRADDWDLELRSEAPEAMVCPYYAPGSAYDALDGLGRELDRWKTTWRWKDRHLDATAAVLHRRLQQEGLSLDEVRDRIRYGAERVSERARLEDVLDAGAKADHTRLLDADVATLWSPGDTRIPYRLSGCLSTLHEDVMVRLPFAKRTYPEDLAADPAFPLREPGDDSTHTLLVDLNAAPDGHLSLVSLPVAHRQEGKLGRAMDAFDACAVAQLGKLHVAPALHARSGRLAIAITQRAVAGVARAPTAVPDPE